MSTIPGWEESAESLWRARSCWGRSHTNTGWFPSVPPPLSPVRFTMLVLPHCGPISGFEMYHHNTEIISNMAPTICIELLNVDSQKSLLAPSWVVSTFYRNNMNNNFQILLSRIFLGRCNWEHLDEMWPVNPNSLADKQQHKKSIKFTKLFNCSKKTCRNYEGHACRL